MDSLPPEILLIIKSFLIQPSDIYNFTNALSNKIYPESAPICYICKLLPCTAPCPKCFKHATIYHNCKKEHFDGRYSSTSPIFIKHLVGLKDGKFQKCHRCLTELDHLRKLKYYCNECFNKLYLSTYKLNYLRWGLPVYIFKETVTVPIIFREKWIRDKLKKPSRTIMYRERSFFLRADLRHLNPQHAALVKNRESKLTKCNVCNFWSFSKDHCKSNKLFKWW